MLRVFLLLSCSISYWTSAVCHRGRGKPMDTFPAAGNQCRTGWQLRIAPWLRTAQGHSWGSPQAWWSLANYQGTLATWVGGTLTRPLTRYPSTTSAAVVGPSLALCFTEIHRLWGQWRKGVRRSQAGTSEFCVSVQSGSKAQSPCPTDHGAESHFLISPEPIW